MTAVKQIPAAKIERRDVFVESAAEVGKTFSAKAEKDGDDLVTVAHLKIADLMVPREALDLLIGWPEGMAASRFLQRARRAARVLHHRARRPGLHGRRIHPRQREDR